MKFEVGDIVISRCRSAYCIFQVDLTGAGCLLGFRRLCQIRCTRLCTYHSARDIKLSLLYRGSLDDTYSVNIIMKEK